MNSQRINVLLFLAIFIATAVPIAAAFYLLKTTLQTSLDLGFNQQVVAALDASAENLRTLRKTDPSNQGAYRRQFEAVNELRHVYAQPELVKENILGSLTVYFGLGLVAAVAVALTLAAVLSRRIARSYRATFDELIAQRERLRYLEEMSTWQSMAKMLAHEIKNPLTPIEVLVTSLSKSYRARSAQEFAEQLTKTEAMVVEELGHLKNTVSKFSEFARLPSVQLEPVDLVATVRQQLESMAQGFERARIDLRADSNEVPAHLDATLFRQALTNLVRNGVEANPGVLVRFDVHIAPDDAGISIDFSNDGVPIPAELAPRIFEPYVSSKAGKDNMGLGLAIVRKILIEHGGEISYATVENRPRFRMRLPRARP